MDCNWKIGGSKLKIYLHYKECSFTFNGFYLDEYNEAIPSPNIMINQQLWEYLRCLTNDFKLKENFELKELYTIEDKEIFEIIPFEYKNRKPTKIEEFEQQNSQLMLDLASKDKVIKKLNIQQSQILLESAEKDLKIKDLENDVSNILLQISIGGIK